MTGLARDNVAGIDYLRRRSRHASLPLVLLHGVGSNAQSFEPLIASMPSTFDVIAWNAPGYAASRHLPNPSPAPRDYAEALLAMLDALNVTTCAVVGHSLGCLFAANFAASYPMRVSALALLSPALGYRVLAGDALPPAVQARIDELEAMGAEAFAAKRATRLVGNPQTKSHVVASVQNAMAGVDRDGYAQAVRALGAGNLLADAARVSAPALVAVGSRDAITPPDQARMALAAFKHSAIFVEVEGAGHALPQEEPETTARLILKVTGS